MLAGAFVAAGYFLLKRGESALAARQLDALHSLSAGEAAAVLGTFDPQRAVDRRALVRLLDDSRLELAEAVRLRLLGWLAAGPPATENAADRSASQAAAVALAEELAAAARQFSLPGRRRAAEVAGALLAGAAMEHRNRQTRLRLACETLVRLGDVKDEVAEAAPAGATSPSQAAGTIAAGAPPWPRPLAMPGEPAPLPGGGLAVDVSGPPVPTAAEPSAAPPAAGDAPKRLADAPAEKPAADPAAEPARPAEPMRLRGIPNASPALASPINPIKRIAQQVPAGGPPPRLSLAEARKLMQAPAAQAAAPSALAEVDPLDLMHRLRQRDEGAAAAARQELQRRGFRDVHFRLAEQLLDPDPGQRRQMVRMLPQLPGVDAAWWLAYLCRDSDADVRLAAMTMMATAGTPELLADVESLARGDEDPRIQQQAESLARLRRARANHSR